MIANVAFEYKINKQNADEGNPMVSLKTKMIKQAK